MLYPKQSLLHVLSRLTYSSISRGRKERGIFVEAAGCELRLLLSDTEGACTTCFAAPSPCAQRVELAILQES